MNRECIREESHHKAGMWCLQQWEEFEGSVADEGRGTGGGRRKRMGERGCQRSMGAPLAMVEG